MGEGRAFEGFGLVFWANLFLGLLRFFKRKKRKRIKGIVSWAWFLIGSGRKMF